MRIRSITCFYNPITPKANNTLDRIQKFAQTAITQFELAGFPVQTTRLATVPFPYLLPSIDINSAVRLAQRIEAKANERNFDFLSLGPAIFGNPESYTLIPPMLEATNNVFFGGVIATAGEGVSLPAVRACARVITQVASFSPDGFANLRFSALANVHPWVPFFPAAYHKGQKPAFALAIEAADLAIAAFQAADSLKSARKNLLNIFEEHGRELTMISQELAIQYKLKFKGIDFSPAPYPKDLCSLGKAIELLGAPMIGLPGSLAAAAILADMLDRGSWKKIGFNGLMLPVLEDSTLAERSIHQRLSIKDLLLYSAVCGTGLDTIPLPGDATNEQLSAVLVDIAALSIRLGKPLTARLMPIPGKKAGDPTDFDFDYFANGCILDLPSCSLHGPLTGSETFLLQPREKKNK